MKKRRESPDLTPKTSVKQRKVKLRNKHSNEAGDPCEAFFKKMECSVDPT